MMINNYFYFGDIVAFESRQVLKNELVRLPEGSHAITSPPPNSLGSGVLRRPQSPFQISQIVF
jgi:hypothetical protein